MKLSRSRSSRVKGELDSTIIHITRKEPIHVPKHIGFARGTAPITRQALLDENQWVTLSETLAQMISQEHSLISDYHVQHTFPSPPEKSVEAFLSAFERATVDLDDPIQYEEIRSFVRSFGEMFSSHVALFLLYEEETDSKSHEKTPIADIIRANPLRNTPAIFILRFLYYFPTMMKAEPTDTPAAEILQRNLKLLIDYATTHAQYFFILPSQGGIVKKEGGPSRVVLVLK